MIGPMAAFFTLIVCFLMGCLVSFRAGRRSSKKAHSETTKFWTKLNCDVSDWVGSKWGPEAQSEYLDFIISRTSLEVARLEKLINRKIAG